MQRLLFFDFINKKCTVAEIGIEKNASTKMWREYFKKANIDCFEIDKEKINFAKRDKLKNVKYHFLRLDGFNKFSCKAFFGHVISKVFHASLVFHFSFMNNRHFVTQKINFTHTMT